MRLFHFSDDPNIARFVPQPVRTPAQRPAGFEWLNGLLVWAIDEAHEPLYLFPRECPRILVWPTADTTAGDRLAWFGGSTARMIAYIEEAWLDRLHAGTIYRYELPVAGFEDLKDAGMWVSRREAVPLCMDALDDLAAELKARDVELRAVPSLVPLGDIWRTSPHASGIRLRNAAGWTQPRA